MSELEYKELVLAAFDLKLAAGLLPTELVSSTPGNLKDESIKVFGKRANSKDELLLGSFLGEKEDSLSYQRALQQAKVDVFKPLNNFLKDRSIDTKFKNIELLAWLIDFEPRPYHPNLKTPIHVAITDPDLKTHEEYILTTQSEEIDHQGQLPLLVTQWNKIVSKRKGALLSIITFICAAIYYYIVFFIPRIDGNEGCMIWNEDHYQPVNCREKVVNAQSIPINRNLVTGFKKITRPDTLTIYSVKKVWYINYRGKVDFFTANGNFPLDTTKRLLPMSDHILKKYVYHLTN